MGCYQNRGRTLGDILTSVAAISNLNKKLGVCKDTAAQKGVTVFGLDNEKCWTGQDAANTYNMYGNSGNCNTNPLGNSMGYLEKHSMFVYSKNKDGKCSYSKWLNPRLQSGFLLAQAMRFFENVASVSRQRAVVIARVAAKQATRQPCTLSRRIQYIDFFATFSCDFSSVALPVRG